MEMHDCHQTDLLLFYVDFIRPRLSNSCGSTSSQTTYLVPPQRFINFLLCLSVVGCVMTNTRYSFHGQVVVQALAAQSRSKCRSSRRYWSGIWAPEPIMGLPGRISKSHARNCDAASGRSGVIGVSVGCTGTLQIGAAYVQQNLNVKQHVKRLLKKGSVRVASQILGQAFFVSRNCRISLGCHQFWPASRRPQCPKTCSAILKPMPRACTTHGSKRITSAPRLLRYTCNETHGVSWCVESFVSVQVQQEEADGTITATPVERPHPRAPPQ